MTPGATYFQTSETKQADIINDPLYVRLLQWISALAVFILLMSGLKIFNDSPIDPSLFPPDIPPGGWLAGALAWHFDGIRLLMSIGVAYLVFGFSSGHFWRNLIRFRPMAARSNIRTEVKRLILHGAGAYNPVQRMLDKTVIRIVILPVCPGLTIWKRLQFQNLAHFFGGHEQARKIDFFRLLDLALFLGLALFTRIHASIALAVKDTIRSMFTGWLAQKPPKKIGAST